MSELLHKFLEDAENKAFDKDHRKKIQFNISRYDEAVERGKQQYHDLELARERAAFIRHKVINEMEKYLIEFEANFESRGGKVIWAQDEKDALKEIYRILRRHDTRMLVKSKSMTTEEIELNDFLKKHKIEAVETDLGEYIVQIAGEKPYHIVTPAMHKSKEDVAELFNAKFGTPIDYAPEKITLYVRELLREKFLHADAGITGANFLVSDIGAVALTENEGNGCMSMSFPKVHIVVAGIDKIIPSLKDLDLLWPLLASHGTGQNITVYNSLVLGPRQEGETDGPSEMYVVLINNGRTNVLEESEQRRALSCIHCGACLNACPVYQNIGGHTYNSVYSGPIGSIITPQMFGMKEYKHLSFASTLCGKCTEVCPVKVNLHELLLFNRRDSVRDRYTTSTEKFVMFGAKKVFSHRWMMDYGKAKLRNYAIRKLFAKSWGSRRELPVIPEKNFKQLWEERRGVLPK
ncbi:MAG: LutB/LldF family L-lactate oxidation iron-sulfur protein [Bacteroidales bacterium]